MYVIVYRTYTELGKRKQEKIIRISCIKYNICLRIETKISTCNNVHHSTRIMRIACLFNPIEYQINSCNKIKLYFLSLSKNNFMNRMSFCSMSLFICDWLFGYHSWTNRYNISSRILYIFVCFCFISLWIICTLNVCMYYVSIHIMGRGFQRIINQMRFLVWIYAINCMVLNVLLNV